MSAERHRAPGDGLVVVWAGSPAPALDSALAAQGVLVVPTAGAELRETTARLAPDLVVLDGELAADAEAWAARLSARWSSAASPVIAIVPDTSAQKARSRFGLVLRAASGDAETLSTQLVSTTQSLLRRAPRWRTTSPGGEIGALVARFAERGRAGILARADNKGAVALGEGGSAPSAEAIASSSEEVELLFHERARGRVRVLDGRERAAQTPRPLTEIRVLVAIDGERGRRLARAVTDAGGEVRALPPRRAAIETGKAFDPSVVVVDASSLATVEAASLWEDARLASASLLVLDGDPASSAVVVACADLTTPEQELRRRLVAGEALADRLETLGPARWLKVLGRCGHALLFEVTAPLGVARVELVGGKVQGAELLPRDERAAVLTGRAAIDALLGMPSGRVRVGPKDLVATLGPRPRTSLVPVVASAPPEARRRGLVAVEVVEKHTDVSGALPRSDEAPRPEGKTAPPVEIGDLAEDLDIPTRTYDANDFESLRAKAGGAAPAAAPPPEPAPKAPAAVAEPSPPGRRPLGWYLAAAALALIVGGYATWRLFPDETWGAPTAEPPVARAPRPAVAAPRPAPVVEPHPEVEPAPLVDPRSVAEPRPLDGPVGSRTSVPELLAQAQQATRDHDYEQAEALARQALERSSRNGNAAYRLAVALMRLHRTEEALTWAQNAAEWSPADPLPRSLQGDLYYASGRFPQAVRAYQSALDVAPGYGPAARHLEELRARGVEP